MRARVFLTFVFVWTGLGASASSDEISPFDIDKLMKGEVPPYRVRTEHPRIFITVENKETIIERITKFPEAKKAFQAVVVFADQGMSTEFAEEPHRPRRGGFGWWSGYAESYGAIHQLGRITGITYRHPREAYGRKGVEVMVAFAEQEGYHTGDGHYYTRSTGFACGYDWLQDLMTPEQRKRCVEKLISNTQPPPISDHEGHAYNCPCGQEIVNPLAFYGDGIDDAKAEELIDAIVKETWWGPEGSLTLLEHLTGSGVPSEGNSYLARYAWFVPALEAWYTATGQDYFQAGTFWHGVIPWMLHSALPYGLTTDQRFAQARIQTYCGYYGDIRLRQAHQNILALATGYLARAGANELASAARWASVLDGGPREYFLYGVLMGNPQVPPKPPWEALPTFYVTGDNPGQVFMRSDWSDPDACVLTFSCMKRDTTRTAISGMNTFTLWKNGGPLLVNRAGYRHDYQIKEETFNMVSMYPPGDTPAVQLLQKQTKLTHRNLADFPESKAAGHLLGAEVVPGKYRYAAGDQSPVYRYSFADRVKSFDRQLVWFQSPKEGTNESTSDFVFLFDRMMTTGKDLQPHVVLNMVYEPKVSTDFRAEAKPKQLFPWHDLFVDAPCLTITTDFDWQGWNHKAHARAFVRTLLPKKVKIHRVGGNKEMDHYGRMLTGELPPRDNTVKGLDTGDMLLFQGMYHVNVVYQEMTPKNLFLHAIEATDSRRETPAPIALMEGPDMVGGRAGDCIALFSRKAVGLHAGNVEVPEGVSGTFRLIIADLQRESPYQLDAAKTTVTQQASSAGILYVEEVSLNPGDRVEIARKQ